MLPAAGVDKTVWVSPLYLIGDGRLCMQGLSTHGVTSVGGVDAGQVRHNSSTSKANKPLQMICCVGYSLGGSVSTIQMQ